MKVPFLDLKIVPEEKEGLLSRISKVFSHGQFIMGPEHDELEQVLAEYVSRKYALAVGSGTDALYLTFKSLGVSFGDEVITTPLSWIASTNAFAILGAQPVFVDVREDLNIDPSEKFDIAKDNPDKVEEILNLIESHNSKLVRGKDQLEDRF